jgi:transposase
MKGFTLSPEEITELHVALHAAKKNNIKDAYKINAVILLGSDWSIEEVVDALFLDDETVRCCASKYKEGGLNKLLETFYVGSKPKLSDGQISQLCVELEKKIYLSTKEICAFVRTAFCIDYTVSGMTNLLHRMDYVYKKPKLVPANADHEAQEIFIAQFNEFMENKKDSEAVFFVDGVHPVHNSLAGYGWIKKGQERELKSNTGRDRLNIHGAMNAETYETTIISSEDSINTDSTIQLFEYLEQLYPLASIIYIILDNAKYHFSGIVQEWLKSSRIKLIFLPSYSPELNLIERLWKVFKKNVLYNRFYETYADFKQSCIGFFEKQHEHYEEISSIMGYGLEALA